MRYIDTNVIIKFLVEDTKNIPGIVRLFKKIAKGEERVKLLDLVFFQVIFVLKSFYKVEKEKIIKAMEQILYFKGIEVKNKKILERTLDLWRIHGDDIVDCYLIANMELDNVMELYTLDKKLKKFKIKIVSI